MTSKSQPCALKQWRIKLKAPHTIFLNVITILKLMASDTFE
ncbi:hypothetical protein F0726_02408 [Acidithiobacillus caldus]|nr:hypothetical protein F0726_02408 [Acidithiobacillus caldus]